MAITNYFELSCDMVAAMETAWLHEACKACHHIRCSCPLAMLTYSSVFLKSISLFLLFFQTHAHYAYNPSNLILKWLILMKCIQWLGTKDSGRNTTWKNNLFKKIYVVFVLYFCGSTKMWKEAKEEKLNSWAGIMFITIKKKHHAWV